MSRIGSIDLASFPTKEQRLFKKGEGGKVPESVLYVYWTNFDRRNPLDPYTLICTSEVYDPPWWQFKTNISPEDFNSWEKPRRILFLKSMWEIYRYRKAER